MKSRVRGKSTARFMGYLRQSLTRFANGGDPSRSESSLHTNMLANLIRPCTRLSSPLTRAYAQPAGTRPLIGRYNHVPVELARVQSGKKVSLRDYETQRELKRFSYDLKLQDGKVMPAPGPNFIGTLPVVVTGVG